MTGLLAAEHLGAVVAIVLVGTALVIAARRRPGGWIKILAVVLLLDEAGWWVFLAAGGGEPGQRAQPLPLQLCDVAIIIAALALWTRNQLLVQVTYFWGLAGTFQALITPDLPQHFPSFPYFQYYVAHGGVVVAALVLVVGLRLRPHRFAVVSVAGLTVAYAVLVGVVDAVTGADYMYLRAKPPAPTLLDLLGPWPVYILSSAVIGLVLFAILDLPFRLGKGRAEALC